MIVCHRHKFIFVKTRKTAGTSVEIALSACCGDSDIITPIAREDERIRSLEGSVGPQNYEGWLPPRCYDFRDVTSVLKHRRLLTLRNHSPARHIHALVGRQVWSDYFTFTIERNPFDRVISDYWHSAATGSNETIADFLHRQRRGIANWPLYTIDNQVAVDRVLRYESLRQDLNEVGKLLGLDMPLPDQRGKGGHRKDRRHYTEVLGPSERALVEQCCSEEITHFGYGWGS